MGIQICMSFGVFLLFGIGLADCRTCNYCRHHEYTSHISSLTDFLNSTSDLDPHCLEEEEDFEPIWEIQNCSTACYSETGRATLIYQGKLVNFVIAQKGCLPDFKLGTCVDLTIDEIVASHGFSVLSETIKGCYCTPDYCNIGCDCSNDDDDDKNGLGKTQTCNYCNHHKYSSDDSSLTRYLNSISTEDSHCLKEADDYEPLWEVEHCTTTCFSETGTATLRYKGREVNYVIAQKGCAEKFRLGTCVDLTIDKLVAKHGLTVVSENVKGCYCGRDSCNIGCDCIDKSAAGKALYTYGVLILAVLAEVITLFY